MDRDLIKKAEKRAYGSYKKINPVFDPVELEEVYQEIEGDAPKEKHTKKDIVNENIVYTSFLETPEYILEQVKNATRATRATLSVNTNLYIYICYSKLTGEISEVASFEYQNREYRPIESKLVGKDVIALPTGVEEYGDTTKLINDIKEFLFHYFEPPQFYEKFLPYYVLFTWIYDLFPFVAYLHFIGLSGTGKTVAAETITSICYKSIDVGGSATVSSMFRLADEWRGTVFIDEFEPASFGSDYMAILAFLKTGVSDRNLIRTEGDKKREVDAFKVKAPKIFTSENPINNAGFQSRTFIIKMEKKTRKIPLYKLNNYEKEAISLRNKLLLWRLRHIDKIDLTSVEYGYPELEAFDGRVQQVLTPFYYLSDDKTKKEILEFAKEQQEETFRERRESIEGRTMQAIIDIYPNPVTLSQVAEALNKGEAQAKQITERRLGNIVRKILRFEIDRLGHENVSTVVVDEERLKELTEYYGLEFVPDASVAQVAHVADESQGVDDKIIDELFNS